MLDSCAIECRSEEYRGKVIQKESQLQTHRFPRIPLRVVRAKVLIVETIGNTRYRHEELYVEIEDMVIGSDEIPDSPVDVSRMFGDVTVVLCTLGMLSNPKLSDCGLFRLIPVRSLVIDEASQIDVFEFMVIPVFSRHSRAIGDFLNIAPLLQVLQWAYKSQFLRRS
jgi:hypothetical protein